MMLNFLNNGEYKILRIGYYLIVLLMMIGFYCGMIGFYLMMIGFYFMVLLVFFIVLVFVYGYFGMYFCVLLLLVKFF